MANPEVLDPPQVFHLPPKEDRLWEPSDGRIPTPLDDRDLIDVPQLITDVKSLVDPSHRWSGPLGVHHFYWFEEWYPHIHDEDAIVNPAHFRNIAPNKGLVPRELENWLHVVTDPAPVPDPEVMAHAVEAWRVATNLFKAASDIVLVEKQKRRRQAYVASNPQILKPEFNGEDVIGQETMQEILERHFSGLAQHIESFQTVPEDFWLVDPEKPIPEVAKRLGSLVKTGHRVLSMTSEPLQPVS